MTTTFDTSGTVICTANVFPTGQHPLIVKWPDLSPFTQGYIEALFEDGWDWKCNNAPGPKGFSDLAPETLARIIADCEAYDPAVVRHNPAYGRQLWTARQAGFWEGFPPLTVQLGDDGKVRFA